MPEERRFEAVAWGWVEHLRRGGTTPWREWAPSGALAESVPDRPLPGAAQLEVVRRLAIRSADPTRNRTRSGDPARLADLVLKRSGPGRGLPDLPLAWPEQPAAANRIGAPPVDPAEIPTDELVRVTVGALVELLLAGTAEPPDASPAAGRPPASGRPRRARRRPWSKQFHLAGAPVSTAELRSALAGAGRVEGGRRPEVVVVAARLDEMLKQVWTSRVQSHASETRWMRFVTQWEHRRRLPMSADLPVIAQHWADRVGASRVHVLVAPEADTGDVRRTAAEILGVAEPGPPANPFPPVPMRPPEVDVFRRVNAIVNLKLSTDRHRALLPRVTALLAAGGSEPLQVPEAHAAWARERSEQMVRDLSAGGYAVHGDLDAIVADRRPGVPSVPGAARALDVALDACLTAAEQEG